MSWASRHQERTTAWQQRLQRSTERSSETREMTEVNSISEKETKLEELAADVLEIARGRLLVNLRYMDVALTFHERKVYHGSFSTDGRVFYYDPVFTLRTYR